MVSLCRVAKIVVAGLGGSGDREGKWEEKIQPTRAKSGVFVPKIPFFAEILFLEHTLSEEIILTEVRLVRSPIIDVALALWNI